MPHSPLHIHFKLYFIIDVLHVVLQHTRSCYSPVFITRFVNKALEFILADSLYFKTDDSLAQCCSNVGPSLTILAQP